MARIRCSSNCFVSVKFTFLWPFHTNILCKLESNFKLLSIQRVISVEELSCFIFNLATVQLELQQSWLLKNYSTISPFSSLIHPPSFCTSNPRREESAWEFCSLGTIAQIIHQDWHWQDFVYFSWEQGNFVVNSTWNSRRGLYGQCLLRVFCQFPPSFQNQLQKREGCRDCVTMEVGDGMVIFAPHLSISHFILFICLFISDFYYFYI